MRRCREEQGEVEDGELAYYVLLITSIAAAGGSGRVWERIGVAVLRAVDIDLEAEGTKLFIQ